MTISNHDINKSVALALASVIGQRDDCEDMARKVADYCAATLRDPRSLYRQNPVAELVDVVKLLDEDTRDLGCVQQHASLHYRWHGISHETLHLILGQCPDAD